MPLKTGDYFILYHQDKKYLLSLKEKIFHTHKGSINLSELEGKEYGEKVISSAGESFYILKPTLFDFIMKLKRITQIIYPKDLGYILLKMGVKEGKIFIECGAGSGALTCVLAYLVGEEGQVISYEKEEKFLRIAQENVMRLGLEKRVVFKLKEVKESFDEEEVDGIFLDVKEPWNLLEAAYKALKGGHPLGILVPTTNQVTQTLTVFTQWPFVDIEVVEILLRSYKPNPERLRPTDQMVAHTGYLIFAKKVL
ncbi:MAG: tRNA (adenine-N1)-methyltransferase [Caldimicrobium sp.]